MGACFNSMELDGKLSKDDVLTTFNDRCSQDGFESGHSYSGSFSEFSGLHFADKIFLTWDDADEYVSKHGEKWGPAVAVRYHHADPSKTVLNHDKARRLLQQRIWDAEAGVSHFQRKAQYNNRTNPPAYVTKAVEKLERIKISVQPKIDERSEKIRVIQIKLAKKSKDIRWMIGGWCSS